jgi:NAD(P)-dependent dehydrogenase (short-subunit alcohol dehydrogenase family)
MGATVIMGCRSLSNCQDARTQIQVFLDSMNAAGKLLVIKGAPCDLSSLRDVQAFAAAVEQKYGVPDIIINNAGFSPSPETAKLTKDGLEGGFGSMHIGHFYLNKLLLEKRGADAKPVRVVNVASGMHRVCYLVDCFEDAFLNGGGVHQAYSGCVGMDTCSYGRAKFANVLHTWAMPKHYAKVSTASIDLGWVATSIQPWMKQGLLNPERLHMIRQADVGVNCILHAAAGGTKGVYVDQQGPTHWSHLNHFMPGLDTSGQSQVNGGLVNSLGRAGIPGQSDFLVRFAREVFPARYSTVEQLLGLREELWDFSEKILQETLAKL